MAQREGVGEKSEQLITKISISLGLTLALRMASPQMSNRTVSASSREASIDRSAAPFVWRHCVMPGGHAVACPVPERARMRSINSRDSSVKHPWQRIISIMS